MVWSAAQIERVVREVLAELALEESKATPSPQAGEGGERSAPGESPRHGATGHLQTGRERNPPSPPASLPAGEGRSLPSASASTNAWRAPRGWREESAQAGSPDGELILSRQVVTLADVGGRLEGVRRVLVPAGAVVTPAVRDELMRRKVALGCIAAQAQAGQRLRLVMLVVARRFDPLPLAAALERQGVAVEQAQLDCLIAATDRLARELAQPNSLGLLLTRHTAAALCLANRRRMIRAILGREPVELAADAQAVGANLLVVDPDACSAAVLLRMVREFCAQGVRDCPEALRRGLA